MKFVLGLLIGIALGGWFGINYGKDEPLWSNPFAENSLQDDLEDVVEKGSELVEMGEDMVEKGKELLPEKQCQDNVATV